MFGRRHPPPFLRTPRAGARATGSHARARIAALALLLIAGAAAAGDMYKWQDENGIWHFSDKPPKNDRVGRSMSGSRTFLVVPSG